MDSPKDLTGQIMSLVFDLSRILRKRMTHAHDQAGCPSMLHIHLLHMVSEHDGMTMSEVAEQMKVSSPTATSFVTKLVEQGLLERASDASNRKLVRLRVTAAGKTLLSEKMQKHREAFALMLGQLPQNDQEDFARILEKILDNLRLSSSL